MHIGVGKGYYGSIELSKNLIFMPMPVGVYSIAISPTTLTLLPATPSSTLPILPEPSRTQGERA